MTATFIAPGSDVCGDAPMSEHPTPGSRLRALREERGLSRDAVNEATGIPGQTLYRYEEKGMEIGTDALLVLAALYRTDPRWIVRGDPPSVEVAAAFAAFEATIAPTLDPPMTLAERGHLIWMRQHGARADRYYTDLLDERRGESEAEAKASAEATEEARARGATWAVKTPTRRRGKR